MKLICAGLMKTGTKSITCALRILGYKVYDFDEQLLHYGEEFYKLFYQDQVPDFYGMFKDVDAVVDYPCNLFFEELMEAFPEAKVILSVRDEDAWVKSCKNQIEIIYSVMKRIRFLLVPSYKRLYLNFAAWARATLGTNDPNASYIYRKRYRWHNDRVKSVVPAEKLLVYSVGEGWEPLCRFTGKEIPDQPFPHLNIKGALVKTFLTDTGYGQKIVQELKFVKQVLLVFCVSVIGIIVYFLLN